MINIVKVLPKFKIAWKGRKEWIKLCRLYGITDRTIVIIMPHENCEYNELVIKYIEDLHKNRKTDDIIIFTYDKSIINRQLFCNGKPVRIIMYSHDKMKHLFAYYCLLKFHPYLYIASLTEPIGNSGQELIGFKGITLDEIIYTAVCRLYFRSGIK